MSSRFINTGSSRLRPPLYTSRPKAQSSNHFPPASNLPRHMGSSSLTPVNAEYLLMIPKLMPTPPGSPSAFQIHICGWVPHISTSSLSHQNYQVHIQAPGFPKPQPFPPWSMEVPSIQFLRPNPVESPRDSSSLTAHGPSGFTAFPESADSHHHPGAHSPALLEVSLHHRAKCAAQCDERKWGFCENKALSRAGLAEKGPLKSQRVITRAPDTLGTRGAEKKGLPPRDRKTGWGGGGWAHGRAFEPARDSRSLHAQKSCKPLKTTILKIR